MMSGASASARVLQTFCERTAEAHSQLDLPWKDGRYVVVDFETTGLSDDDAIISFGAVHIDQGRIIGTSAVYGLVQPEVPVSAAAIGVHAIRPGDLANAPRLPEALDPLLAAMAGRVLVAHAAWIERAFLGRALATRGIYVQIPVIDTAELAWQHLGLVRATDRAAALEALSRRLGLPVHTPHHALGDARTTALVFLAMAAHRAASGPVSVRDLVHASESKKHGLVSLVRRRRRRR